MLKRKIVVINPEVNGKVPAINPPELGSIYINGLKLKRETMMKSSDIIEFNDNIEIGKRFINISFNSDKTEDFLSIDYEKNKKYILLDLEKTEFKYRSVNKRGGISSFYNKIRVI